MYGPQGYYPPPKKKGWGCFTYGLLGIFVLLGSCFIIAGIGRGARAKTSNGGETSTATRAERPEPPPKDWTRVSAHQLAADYDANEVSADNAWKRVDVEVSGVVRDISKGPLGGITVFIGDDPYGLSGVHVKLKRSESSSAASLVKGRTETFHGKVLGKILSSVVVDAAQIVSVP